MSTYFILANWTEQGIKAVKDSPKRLRAAKRLAKDCKVKFRSFHMTLGQYDGVAIVEASNDAAVARFALALSSAGNVRTLTLKGFAEQEYRAIVGSLP